MSNRNTFESIKERYEPEPNSGCWLFNGSLNTGGYGSIAYQGKRLKAHRLFYEIYKGEIINNLNVLHKCDNPACCNPDHLFLGTQLDNMRDCSRKKRMRPKDQRGEKHALVTLSNSQVLEMRELRKKTNISFAKIAKIYGVTAMTAYRAINKINWSHI